MCLMCVDRNIWNLWIVINNFVGPSIGTQLKFSFFVLQHFKSMYYILIVKKGSLLNQTHHAPIQMYIKQLYLLYYFCKYNSHNIYYIIICYYFIIIFSIFFYNYWYNCKINHAEVISLQNTFFIDNLEYYIIIIYIYY